MKYKLSKHLKTVTKTIGLFNNRSEAKAKITELGLKFKEINYYGGNPVYLDEAGKVYSISGAVITDIGTSILCSIPDGDVKFLTV